MKGRTGWLFVLAFMLVLGNVLLISYCFTEDPNLTDPYGDADNYDEDLVKMWITNDETYLRFKIEISGYLDFEDTVFNYVGVGISISNNTGNDWEGDLDIPIDYFIYLEFVYDLDFNFLDYNNSSNSLTSTHIVNLSYYEVSNYNHTVEFGYMLKSYTEGKGYLNCSFGQTINVIFYASTFILADYSPDQIGNGFFIYTLTSPKGIEDSMTILIISILLASTGGLGLLLLWRYRKLL